MRLIKKEKKLNIFCKQVIYFFTANPKISFCEGRFAHYLIIYIRCIEKVKTESRNTRNGKTKITSKEMKLSERAQPAKFETHSKSAAFELNIKRERERIIKSQRNLCTFFHSRTYSLNKPTFVSSFNYFLFSRFDGFVYYKGVLFLVFVYF